MPLTILEWGMTTLHIISKCKGIDLAKMMDLINKLSKAIEPGGWMRGAWLYNMAQLSSNLGMAKICALLKISLTAVVKKLNRLAKSYWAMFQVSS